MFDKPLDFKKNTLRSQLSKKVVLLERVRLCLHILPDDCWFVLAGLGRTSEGCAWVPSFFYRRLSITAGFHSEKLKNRQNGQLAKQYWRRMIGMNSGAMRLQNLFCADLRCFDAISICPLHTDEASDSRIHASFLVLLSVFQFFSFMNRGMALSCHDSWIHGISELFAGKGAFIPSSAFCFGEHMQPRISA